MEITSGNKTRDTASRPIARLLLLSLCAACGCAQQRQTLDDALLPALGMRVDLSSRFARYGTRLTYRRTNPQAPDAPPIEYEVLIDGQGREEGALIGHFVSPLQASLGDREGGDPPRKIQWPSSEGQYASAFFLEFDPPLEWFPSMLTGNDAFESVSDFILFGRGGRARTNGSVKRRIKWEGYETLEIDGKKHSDCVRLHAETTVSFSWLAGVRMTEHLWLAPRRGVIKRLRRLNGRILFKTFESETHDELIQAKSQGSRKSFRPRAPQRWKRCAVYLRPTIPQPQVAGLVVELADGESQDEIPGNKLLEVPLRYGTPPTPSGETRAHN